MKQGNLGGKIVQGAFGGMGVGQLIVLSISTVNGNFLPAAPELVEKMGTLGAAQLSLVLTALLGIIGFVSSSFWEKESWSLLKSSLVSFFVNLLAISVIGYALYWFPHKISPFIGFIIVFTIIFFLIWLIIYTIEKKKIRRMNESLGKRDGQK